MAGQTSNADVATVNPPQRRDRFAVVVGAVALGLGLFAFVADLVDGVAGQVLVALTSSGFAWGLAAFLVGRAASTRQQAAIGGGVLLVVATLLYYLLVVLVSRRWSGGWLYDEATGVSTPADMYGLRSIAITASLWLVGSAIAGPVLALLGQTVRSAGAIPAALAVGLTCGLLSGEGWYALWRFPLWRMDFSDPYSADFFRARAVSQVIRVLLPVVVLAWLAIAHRLGRAWATLVVSTVTSALVGALIWAGVEHARNLV